MYVRGAKNREEVWLLERIDELGLSDPAFRSRDYVVAVDETTNTKTGFGRIRVYPDDPELCELRVVGVLEEHRNCGIGAHVIERLLELAGDRGFQTVYSLTASGGYLSQFGFQAVEPSALPERLRTRLEAVEEARGNDAIAMAIDPGAFEMPQRLRQRFKHASTPDETEEPDPGDSAEDFGIDPEEATYKYDTGG